MEQSIKNRFLSLSEIQELTTLSKTSLWRLRRSGNFPDPIKITGSRRIVWLEKDFQNWMDTQVNGGCL